MTLLLQRILNKAHYFLVFIVQIILNQHFEQRLLLLKTFDTIYKPCQPLRFGCCFCWISSFYNSGWRKRQLALWHRPSQKVPTGAWGALLFGFVPTGTGGFVLATIITVSLCLPFLLLLFFELLFGLDSSFCWPPPLALCNPHLNFFFCVQSDL